MIAHIGAVVAIGFLLASAIMNYLFGHSLGRTPLEAFVYGIVGVLAVISNGLCPFMASKALKARRMPTLYAVVGFWVLCLAYSLTSAIGFAAENRQAIAAPKASLQEILKLRLDTLKDLEARKRTPQIEVRIHGLREEITKLHARGAAADSDPQTSLFARILGLDPSHARLALLVMFALVVEAGAAIALFATLSFEASNEALPRRETANGKSKIWNPGYKPAASRADTLHSS